ncbi:MAG: four helix bundle protein [Flavobacteriales bacterium]|nr:four helix bundle protein [Flavobacteriales bacterium]
MKHNFRNLKIWQESMMLTQDVLVLTKSFPKSEIFSLVSQINRSAISVPSNIAEGSSRSSKKEFNRFLEISLGSLYELQTQLILANSLNYIKNNDFEKINEKTIEIQKMISGFQTSLFK